MPSSPKSNTIVFWPLAAAAFAIAIATVQSNAREETKTQICLIAFSTFFWASALAQLRSGYRWKNMTQGNRGAHKSEEPKRYLLSVSTSLLIAGAMIVIGIIKK
jgi:adenosine deaminase